MADYSDAKREFDRLYAADRTLPRAQPDTEAPAWRKHEMEELLAQANMKSSLTAKQVTQMHSLRPVPRDRSEGTYTATTYLPMEVLIAQAHMNNSFSAEQVSQVSAPISLGPNEWTTPEESPEEVPAYNLYLDCELCGKPGKRGCNGDICGELGPQGSPYPPEPVSILEEAITITSGARRRDYGHPYDNFRKTGVMWGAQLEAWMQRAKPGDPVPARLVAAMMVSLKLVRDTQTPKRDNPVDIAGYAYCMDEVAREESRRRLGANVTTDPDLPQ